MSKKDKNTFVVEIIGGLGNQMFCYAFAQAIKHKYNTPVTLYTGRFAETKDNQGYELSRIFDIQDPIIDNVKDVKHLTDFSMSVFARARRRFFGVKPTYFNEKIHRYDESVLNLKPRKQIYLQGLWQDEDYFKDIRSEILKRFDFKPELDTTNQEIVAKMHASNSASMHIRRGDYFSNPQYMGLLGGVCNYDYYFNAFKALESQEENLSWFIFSDDIEWAKENLDFLQGKDIIFINHNKGLDSYKDMQLMSNCKHNIIANSSFSWWGAWLNQNPKKKVLAPQHWFMNSHGYENNHLVPDHWQKITNIPSID